MERTICKFKPNIQHTCAISSENICSQYIKSTIIVPTQWVAVCIFTWMWMKNKAWMHSCMPFAYARMLCMGYKTKENRSEKWIFSILYFVFETIEPSANRTECSEQQTLFNARLVFHIRTHRQRRVLLALLTQLCSIASGSIVVVNQPIKIKELLAFISFVQLLRVYGFTGRYRLHGRTCVASTVPHPTQMYKTLDQPNEAI